MKKRFSCLLVALSGLFALGSIDAALIKLQVGGVAYTDRQPIKAVVVDCNGQSIEQTVYYNAALGGIDFVPACAGPSASIYFPAIQTGYIWNNGFWVDREGYYWDGGRRIYLNHPNWGAHWGGYWDAHPHAGWDYGYRGGDVHFHEGYHERGEDHRDFHGGDHHENHGGDYHGGGHHEHR